MSFFIIPHSSSFVNPFQKFFSNFLFCGAPSCETALILYHIQSSLSSTFFKFFQKTFLWPLFRFQTSFSIISHPNSFVNPFSEVFQICFSWYLSYLCDSSSTISLSHRFVKYFYLSFWFYQLISDTSPPDFRPLRTFVLNQQSYRFPSFRCALVRQLLYYSMNFAVCQLKKQPLKLLLFRHYVVICLFIYHFGASMKNLTANSIPKATSTDTNFILLLIPVSNLNLEGFFGSHKI